jgi:hypothetical protein
VLRQLAATARSVGRLDWPSHFVGAQVQEGVRLAHVDVERGFIDFVPA